MVAFVRGVLAGLPRVNCWSIVVSPHPIAKPVPSPLLTVLTVPQVYALAEEVGDRYCALVLLAVFGSLRWGQLAALRRSDIDFQARTVRVSGS